MLISSLSGCIVSVKDTITSAPIQNVPRVAAIVGERNRHVLLEQSLCSVKSTLSCKHYLWPLVVTMYTIWNAFLKPPASLSFSRTFFLGTLLEYITVLSDVKKHLCYSTFTLRRPVYKNSSAEFSPGCVKALSHVIISVIII